MTAVPRPDRVRKPAARLWDDVRRYVTGRAAVRPAPWREDAWVYPPDWTFDAAQAAAYFGPFDERGVPLEAAGGALRYNPSRIAGFALWLWNHQGEPDCAARFLACSDWFAEAPDTLFYYRFDAGGMRAPWLSCIAQGQGASVLARAYRLTRMPRYAEAAAGALRPLERPVAEAGLQDTLPDGSPFLEEYPGRFPHVLNGCLHALVGIDDAARAGGAPRMALFDRVADAVSHNFALWDHHDWSAYDATPSGRVPNLATMNYHMLHCILLRYLADRGGSSGLAAIADRWEASARRLHRRGLALLGKLRYRAVEGW